MNQVGEVSLVSCSKPVRVEIGKVVSGFMKDRLVHPYTLFVFG